MCMKTPKPKKVEEKPVQYLRNPFLDGLAIGQSGGRNALRTDVGASPYAGRVTESLGLAPAGQAGVVVPGRPTKSGYRR